MGLFDSIGTGLGSITKALDVGGVARSVIDGVLPKDMAFVGDLAGALVDFKTGNFAGGVRLAMEALHDLPQNARTPQQPGPTANPAGNAGPPAARPQLEPSPPPLTSRDGKPFDWSELLSAIKALTAALNGQAAAQASAGTTAKPTGAPDAPRVAAAQISAPSENARMAAPARTAAPAPTPATTPAPAAPAPAATPAPAVATATPAARPAPATATPTPAALPTTSYWRQQASAAQSRTRAPSPGDVISAYRSPRGGWRPAASAARTNGTWDQTGRAGHATTAASSTANHAPAASRSPTPRPPSPASATHPAAAPTATSSSTGDKPATKPASAESTSAKSSADKDNAKTITSLSQLQGMSDAAIQDAVINGRISPDLLKDPGAVMVLQQRMNAISEMNNLMTTMMRAIHDMHMAVIQNIRI
jgi:hypothetical protein